MSTSIGDARLLDIACDVTIRFRAHRSYGSEKGALKALRRRAPGYTPDEYQAVLQFLCKVYDRAKLAVPRHVLNRPDKTSKFDDFEDIDYAACLRILNRFKPGVALREKRWILNWCIFWYYLK
jgi:hypothetical protein